MKKLRKWLIAENVGGWDLWLRALIGSVGITALALDWIPPEWELWVGIIVAASLFTSIMRHCSPYALVGFSTKKR